MLRGIQKRWLVRHRHLAAFVDPQDSCLGAAYGSLYQLAQGNQSAQPPLLSMISTARPSYRCESRCQSRSRLHVQTAMHLIATRTTHTLQQSRIRLHDSSHGVSISPRTPSYACSLTISPSLSFAVKIDYAENTCTRKSKQRKKQQL